MFFFLNQGGQLKLTFVRERNTDINDGYGMILNSHNPIREGHSIMVKLIIILL